ncbi:hypothetical protein [Geobacter sp. FeAm09]|uniref:hypothetical protein n=1 Tax=Geobacter sp. FeAm09 TaxID=2597769 RepID=UPI00143D3D79|nr:hypothetical protein [Geobacter sp. FeAm09]
MASKSAKICAVTDSRQRAKLSSEPAFYCSRCGAKTHSSASVCEPVPFEPDH